MALLYLNPPVVSKPDQSEMPELIILYSRENRERCQWLAADLALPVRATAEAGEADFALELKEAGLQLRDLGRPRFRPLRLDFDLDRGAAGSRNLLKRALGAGIKDVVDATAGWVADALRLARAGLRVTALEREPVVAALLKEAWLRCTDPTVKRNLRIVEADAIQWLPTAEPSPDAVYIDTMFPDKRKQSAAVKKEMAILQRLVGRDADEETLLAAAIDAARRRVVVKRPLYAPILGGGQEPSGAVRGKLVRFDIYPGASS